MNVWLVDRMGPKLPVAIYARKLRDRSPVPEDPQLTAERLEQWLNASRALTSSRRAAALLIADYYMSCPARAPRGELKDRYVRMGADFSGGCPTDAEYGHNFRKQARKSTGMASQGNWPLSRVSGKSA
jgi:hypothetical protein